MIRSWYGRSKSGRNMAAGVKVATAQSPVVSCCEGILMEFLDPCLNLAVRSIVS